MELVLPQAGKMTHALKKLHIVERCFRTGAEGKAAPSALHESKGIFSFAKENIPFWNGSACQVMNRNDLSYFYLRCRFACDSAVFSNFRLLWIV